MHRSITFVLAAALAACSSNPAVTPPDDTAAAAGPREAVLTTDASRWRHDAYQFVGMRVQGDTLHVDVQYGGGCATHEFALLVSPIFMESYPVQMSGSLAHDAKGDPCRALIGSTLAFDLSPLRRAYQQAYRVESDVIHLNVTGWPERVVYRF